MNKMRICVFIDGSNFYFRLKGLTAKVDRKYSLLRFNFRNFSEWLVGDNELVGIHYYVGAVKRQLHNEKSKKMFSNQQKLLRGLQKQNITVTLGQLIQHPDKTYHEKGVDVRIAVEMICFARQDKYDLAYLISSDTDLVPAVEEIFSLSKKVKYIGATDSQSFGLSKVTGDYLILRSKDIEQFFPKILI